MSCTSHTRADYSQAHLILLISFHLKGYSLHRDLEPQNDTGWKGLLRSLIYTPIPSSSLRPHPAELQNTSKTEESTTPHSFCSSVWPASQYKRLFLYPPGIYPVSTWILCPGSFIMCFKKSLAAPVLHSPYPKGSWRQHWNSWITSPLADGRKTIPSVSFLKPHCPLNHLLDSFQYISLLVLHQRTSLWP